MDITTMQKDPTTTVHDTQHNTHVVMINKVTLFVKWVHESQILSHLGERIIYALKKVVDHKNSEDWTEKG